MNQHNTAIAAIAKAKCISLTTFKRDGTPVSTPVWFNILNGKICITTPTQSWKVKRISNNPRVEFATCTQRGKVTGPVFTGEARVLTTDETLPVMKAKRRRYRSARLIQLIPANRIQIGIEIVADTHQGRSQS